MSELSVKGLSAVRPTSEVVSFLFAQYSKDNTGAYSPFKRLRLKPPCAQNTSNSKEERASVFPEFVFSFRKTGFYTALSAFSVIGVFVQP